MVDREPMKLLSVRITKPLYERMQQHCKDREMTRSEFIRLAIHNQLNGQRGGQIWLKL